MPYEIDPAVPILANLKRAKNTLQLLEYTYGRTDVLLADAPYTMVPAEYCQPDMLHDIYLQNFPFTSSHSDVMCGDVCECRIKLLYAADKALLHGVNTLFPEATICHSVQPLLAFFIGQSTHSFVVNLHEKKADLLFIDDGYLKFLNTFVNVTADDTAYYILGVWQMLGLSQTDDMLYLAGKSSDTRALMHTLERFIRRTEFLLPVDVFHGTELARLDGVPLDLCAQVSL